LVTLWQGTRQMGLRFRGRRRQKASKVGKPAGWEGGEEIPLGDGGNASIPTQVREERRKRVGEAENLRLDWGGGLG